MEWPAVSSNIGHDMRILCSCIFTLFLASRLDFSCSSFHSVCVTNSSGKGKCLNRLGLSSMSFLAWNFANSNVKALPLRVSTYSSIKLVHLTLSTK